MAFHRDLTTEELDTLLDQNLSQLEAAVIEFKAARLDMAKKQPTADLARRRLVAAYESLTLCLNTFEQTKSQLIRSQQ